MKSTEAQTETAATIAAKQPPIVETGVANLLLVHDNYQKADIEKMLPHRIRPRGDYKTGDLKSFADFLAQNNINPSGTLTVFVNADRMSAVCPLNFREGDAYGHCDFTAILVLKKTAVYAAMQENNNKRISQRDFAILLEDWSDSLAARSAAGEQIDIVDAIRAVRSMSIDAARSVATVAANMSESRSVMEQVEAKSLKGTLPAYFEIIDPCYFGLPYRAIRLRLVVSTADENPCFKVMIVGAEHLAESIADDFCAVVSETLVGANVLQGVFA